jgi:hypothetical protein
MARRERGKVAMEPDDRTLTDEAMQTIWKTGVEAPKAQEDPDTRDADVDETDEDAADSDTTDADTDTTDSDSDTTDTA